MGEPLSARQSARVHYVSSPAYRSPANRSLSPPWEAPTLSLKPCYIWTKLCRPLMPANCDRVSGSTLYPTGTTQARVCYKYPDISYIVSIHAWNDYGLATWTGIGLKICTYIENQTVHNAWLDEEIRLRPLESQYPHTIYTMEATRLASYGWFRTDFSTAIEGDLE
ncbi:hypothetical protein SCARD494_11511 [Seiridium cardinale]